MFRNKKDTNMHQFRPKIYFSYIFIHFACIFFACFFILFIILTAINQIDSDNNYSFTKNLFFSSMSSFDILINNINIITITSCIFFFIRIEKNFNICVLQSFGLTSILLLKPIIIFLVTISLFKTFCLNPLYIKLENYKKDKLEYRNFLKIGTNFTIIDQKDINDYMIINGVYDKHSYNDDFFNFTKAKFFQFKKKKLAACYIANKAVLSKNEFSLLNANVTYIKNTTDSLQNTYNVIKLHSNQTVKNMVTKIINVNKSKKAISRSVYDHIKLLLQHQSSIKNETEITATLHLLDNLTSLLNAVLCCLISFLFCTENTRKKNVLKFSLECFIVCFIILRIFDFLMKTAILSAYNIFCIISASLLLCCFAYFLILNKDWCNFYKQIIIYKFINRYHKV